MKQLYVAFLWHMHQPNYRDPIRGYYSMPWVRLHATKAYYDMAVLADSYPEMDLTFNLVPSLLEQIEDYAGGAEDFELMLSKRDPAGLTSEEKEAILSRFFQANHDTMIKPMHRYIELLQYRGVNGTWSEIDIAVNKFSAQDFLDLQVLFNLTWFGFTIKDNDNVIRKLIRKGRHYTIEDRDLILEKQHEIITQIIPLYKDLWKKGSIDITTSPLYHPILPLLCDTSSALEGMPGCLLPKQRYEYPEDAAKQVEMGIDYIRQKLGTKPAGMWPSEGSVSPAALDIIHDAGIKWVATDDKILMKSIKHYSKDKDLYHPWKAHGVGVFFRDHFLSDQIGFVYARNSATIAVDDFVGKLKAIAASGGDSPRCVSVILDGENAWEYFPNSGKDFLNELYKRILSEKNLKPVTFSKFLEENPPGSKIKSIFPGSWINGNFDTWIGDQEEVDGWDVLKNAREKLVEKEKRLSEEESKEAWLEIFRAEGSDWFWWYGEDHASPNDPEFDRLFRAHLERVYNIIGVETPSEIIEPIIKKQSVRADVEPTGLLTPVIDGRLTTFYEWLSAGWFPATGPEGSMSGGKHLISSVYYGFDLTSLYFRFDFTEHEEPIDITDWSLSIQIQNGESYRIDVSLDDPDNYILFRKSKDRWVRRTRKKDVAAGKIIELGVSFNDLNMESRHKGFFTATIYEKGLERERLPRTGSISFVVPDENFQSMMWQL